MMQNPKKIAMLIVRGLKDFQDSHGSSDYTSEASKKDEPSDNDDQKMGVESAMEKFIEAVSKKDAKLAVKAMMEFTEMSGGMEYHSDGDCGSDDKGPGEY